MPAGEPDKRLVPESSHSAGAFLKFRDCTVCFPDIEKVLIHLETPEGQQIANDALVTLKLRQERVEDVTFRFLWAAFIGKTG